MKLTRIFLLVGGLGAGLLLGGIILWMGTPRMENPFTIPNGLPKIGSPIPTFELPDSDGKVIKSKDYLGKPLIINFWATWCAPCKLEMPLLQKMAQRYDKELSLVGVNFEESKDIVVQYIHQNNIDIQVLLDEPGKIADAFGVHAFPVTFFVDKDGVLRSMHFGQLDEPLIQTYLQTIGITE